MTKDDIIRMAQEAGFDAHDMSDDFSCNVKDIERLVIAAYAAGAKDEREACAKECEAEANGRSPNLFDALCDCADAIRARGEK